MRVFKEELRQALASPGELPKGELENAVEFSDKNEAAFLRRLWRDLTTTSRPDLSAVPSWTWILCVLRYASAL